MTSIEFIVLSLATLRITWLLLYEEGPYEIFSKLRYWSGIRQLHEIPEEQHAYYIEKMNIDLNNSPYPEILHQNELLANILSCIYCCSIWVGLGVAILFNIEFFNLIFYGLSFSALALILRKYI